MSCDHKLVTEHLEQYLDGLLDADTRSRMDAVLGHCEHCRDVVEQAAALSLLGRQWRQQAVPGWHRTRFAAAPVQRNVSGVSWAALAASCLSLLLVIFRMEVSTVDGLTISFGGQQQEAKMQQQLTARLDEFANRQAEQIATELSRYRELQTSQHRLQLAEWLERNRDERQDDLEYLMTSWEARHYRDQQQTEEILSKLTRNQIRSDQYLNELLKTAQFTQRGSL